MARIADCGLAWGLGESVDGYISCKISISPVFGRHSYDMEVYKVASTKGGDAFVLQRDLLVISRALTVSDPNAMLQKHFHLCHNNSQTLARYYCSRNWTSK